MSTPSAKFQRIHRVENGGRRERSKCDHREHQIQRRNRSKREGVRNNSDDDVKQTDTTGPVNGNRRSDKTSAGGGTYRYGRCWVLLFYRLLPASSSRHLLHVVER